jgi:ribosomal protein S28E/S33
LNDFPCQKLRTGYRGQIDPSRWRLLRNNKRRGSIARNPVSPDPSDPRI